MARRVTIPFGTATIDTELPRRTVEVPPPPQPPPIIDIEAAVRAALDAPLGLPPLRDLAALAAKAECPPDVPRALVCFDDGAIPAFPVAEPDVRAVAVPLVLAALADAGIPPERIRLVCANALHRKWTRGEMARFLGPALPLVTPPERLRCHDSEDEGSIMAVGETARGMEVRVAREAILAPLVVYVNLSASPMNGGWKSIVVGLSDFRSIRHHHRPWPFAQGHSIMDARKSAFHRILAEMGALVAKARADRGLAPIFTVESTYTCERGPARLAGVAAGAIDEAHRATLERLDRTHVAEIPEAFDVAVIGLPSVDPYSVGSTQNPLLALNLGLSYAYGLHQGEPYVKQGGVLILATPMPRAFHPLHHPSYEEFYDRVLTYTRDPVVAWDTFVEDFWRRPEYVHKYRYAFGFHGTHPFFMWNGTAAPRRHLGRIIIAGAHDPEVPRRLGLEHFETVPDAIGSIKKELGKGCSVFLPTFPPPVIYRVRPPTMPRPEGAPRVG